MLIGIIQLGVERHCRTVTRSLRSVFVFTSKGYVDTGVHKTLTHYLERNEKASVWEIVEIDKGGFIVGSFMREKETDAGVESTIDGYKELHSAEGSDEWETVKSDAVKQQLVRNSAIFSSS